MRFFYSNLIDASGVVVTASSQVTTLPASNVVHEFKTKVWRTGVTVADEWITFDLGTARTVQAVAVLAHTLAQTDSNIYVQGNSSDSWGAPAFQQLLAWSAGPIFATFAGATYRYWRIKFTKSAANVSRDIGRIFLGSFYETTDQPEFTGYVRGLNDLSTGHRAEGGQVYSNVRPKARTLKLSFSGIPQAQAESFQALAKTVGEHTSFFWQVDTSGPSEITELWYGKLTKLGNMDISGVGMDGLPAWDCSIELEEAL